MLNQGESYYGIHVILCPTTINLRNCQAVSHCPGHGDVELLINGVWDHDTDILGQHRNKTDILGGHGQVYIKWWIVIRVGLKNNISLIGN